MKNEFAEFSKDTSDNDFRDEFTMDAGMPKKPLPPKPQPRVQYIPTVNGVPIVNEEPLPEIIMEKVKAVVKQKYISIMNKTQLIEVGRAYGLSLVEDMTRKIMQFKIREAKEYGKNKLL